MDMKNQFPPEMLAALATLLQSQSQSQAPQQNQMPNFYDPDMEGQMTTPNLYNPGDDNSAPMPNFAQPVAPRPMPAQRPPMAGPASGGQMQPMMSNQEFMSLQPEETGANALGMSAPGAPSSLAWLARHYGR